MIAIALAAWAGLSVALAAGWARARRRAVPTPPARPVELEDLTALVQPGSWSQAAVDAEFALMIPGLVTADVFALDAQLNRRAQGWAP